jgi:hypothetical protein
MFVVEPQSVQLATDCYRIKAGVSEGIN